VPRVLGGLDIEGNKIDVCEACHSKIHNRSMLQHTKLVTQGIVKAKERGARFGAPKGAKRKLGWKKSYSPDLIKNVQELRAKGLSYRKIGQELSMCFATVGTIIKRHGC